MTAPERPLDEAMLAEIEARLAVVRESLRTTGAALYPQIEWQRLIAALRQAWGETADAHGERDAYMKSLDACVAERDALRTLCDAQAGENLRLQAEVDRWKRIYRFYFPRKGPPPYA